MFDTAKAESTSMQIIPEQQSQESCSMYSKLLAQHAATYIGRHANQQRDPSVFEPNTLLAPHLNAKMQHSHKMGKTLDDLDMTVDSVCLHSALEKSSWEKAIPMQRSRCSLLLLRKAS
jgi:hypothetical protein